MLGSTHPQGSSVCFNIVCLCVCLCLLCVCVLSHVRLFVTSMDYGPPDSSVHRSFQTRLLE